MKLQIPSPRSLRRAGPSEPTTPPAGYDLSRRVPPGAAAGEPPAPADQGAPTAAPDQAPARGLAGIAGSRRQGFDIRNTWQVLAGAILIPVGVASIFLAWYGAAHARVDQQQIPYMVSGGFLGLGAIVAGALLFWAHWLYRIYDQADLHHEQLMRSQAELRDALVEALAAASPGRNLNGSRPPGSEPGAGRFVATASGTNFHRPDCPIVARRPEGVRRLSDRAVKNMAPCRICEPEL